MESSGSGSFARGAAAGAGAVAIVGIAVGLAVFEAPGRAPARVEAGPQIKAGPGGALITPIARGAGAIELAGPADVAALRSQLVAARAAREEAEARASALEAELAKARAALSASPAAPAHAAAPGPRVRYGRWEETALAGADWEAAGVSARGMRERLPKLVDAMSKGAPPPQDLMVEIARDNQKLLALALDAMGKLPTHAPGGNGAYTHPYLLLNVMARHLDAVGLPLDEGQVRALERIGQEYDQAWAQRDAAYGPGALLLEKVTDELALKRETSNAIDAVLSAAQRDALTDASIRHRSQVDIYSPVLLLAGLAAPLAAASEDEVATRLVAFMARWGRLALEPADPLVRTWATACIAGRAPVPRAAHAFFDVDAALQCARAQLAFMRAALARPDTAKVVRDAMATDPALAVPCLVTD